MLNAIRRLSAFAHDGACRQGEMRQYTMLMLNRSAMTKS